MSDKNLSNIDPSDITGDINKISGKRYYANPLDGLIYKSENGWKLYDHTPHPTIDTGIVKVRFGVLLTSQNDISACIDIEQLTMFMKKMDQIVLSSFLGSSKKGELLIQITLSDYNTPKVDVGTKDDVDERKIPYLLDALENLKGYVTKKDSITFQILYGIN